MIPLHVLKKFSPIQSILIAVTLFALGNVIVKSLNNISTIQIVFFRSIIILCFTHFMLKKEKIKIFGHPNQKKLWLRGITGTLGLVLLFWTIKNMPLASAVTLHYLSPVFTVVLSAIFLKEKASYLHYISLVICFIGIAIIKRFDPMVDTHAVAIAVLAALFAAMAYTTIRSLRGQAHPLLIVYYFPLVTLPLLSYPLLKSWVTPTYGELLGLIAIGFLTFWAQLFLTQAYSEAEPKKIAPFNYLGIFYAIIFGVLLFGETISQGMLVGFVLVILGVWWSFKLK